ncbi:MAG: amidohydrolase [Eubacteriales bacterium]|jgi:imidazolonepropionase-like amidohydrolase|nr:amidohydrolase [Eubacteriales bacterium]MDD7415480.1 amidohydrolase [Clostridiales bacterium]MDY5732001.1 amidohydrolase [Eubacteriales bacterium]
MLVIKNARLLTMTENGSFVGDIRIDGGKIAEIAQNIDTTGCDVFDAEGMYAMPGIIDAHSHIGMWEDGMGREGSDGNEATNPVTPEMRSIDGINPFDRCFKEAVACGVTTAVTGPGSANVVGGTFVAMKLYGRSMDEMILKFPVAMKAAFGENPKRVYGDKATPATRMAIAAILRKALAGALDYAKKIENAKDDPSKMPERDLGKEALLPVIRRELPLKIHCHRADDILTAIRIAKEFNVRFTLDHCTEGYLIPDLLKETIEETGAGIIIGPLLTDRSKIELRNVSFSAPKALYDAGIDFAMMTDHPVIPEQYLPVCAALAVREGLPEDAALRSITINAARITGIDDRVGSLEVGKDADIAVFSGHPLDFRSRCVLCTVDGQVAHRE